MNFCLRLMLWSEWRHCNRAHEAHESAMKDAAHFARERDRARTRIEVLNRRIRRDAAITEGGFA